MPEFLTAPFSNGPEVTSAAVAVRLVVALLLGVVVAWVYTRTRAKTEVSPTFPVTLVLLSVLIAMVTQVIGDNVARAFSLVGALSIVRFRTVVRDTQDTAYVIFAVVVGMAIGAKNPWVAAIGIGVIGVPSLLLAWFSQSRAGASKTEYVLTVRVVAGFDAESRLGDLFTAHLQTRDLMSIGTAKQGSFIDLIYHARLRPDRSPPALIQALNEREGVQSAQLQQRGFDMD